ncbi:fluoride efflux transporter CrcB [Pseudomonas mangiferae]|uniref:Fluoride-specific ion channel FluC n=1 Tax=Pseudomonas mangiferae TaxID=2593654 RepID=A0A553H437_9PSED|nr:fluoride efflux transporter CrcB [Pseudomonas mangiferae]TRX76513.1 fluoride efflux transporter CrcB [Pseudomonas mangiferae]
MIRTMVAVALGGAFGSVLRFLTSYLAASQWPRHAFLGTLAVNVVGCLVIGYLNGLFLLRTDLPVELRLGLTVGVIGGLTTFSSFSLEVVRLLENGQTALAMAYLACSILGGLFAVWAGLSFARM